ncbi:MAG: ChbG/HpnK family deacetylase [Rhodospirillales bacterium]|nr:ChbG/HpnK family deacetylase [Rhodospirillales bacterium]
MTPAPARLILCADDYAIAPGVSRAIRALIEAGRLTATSCLTVSPFWPEHARELHPLAAGIDTGIHLALTDLPPLGPLPRLAPNGRMPSLHRLIATAYTGRLPVTDIRNEIACQIDAFVTAFGRPPDFIDGHRHVHQLPVVRDIVADLFAKRFAGRRVWMRVCDEPIAAIFRRGVAVPRALAISSLGRGLRRRAGAKGIPTNRRFAGVRDFTERLPYRDLFARFLAERPDGLLVMCHPGHVDSDLAAVDPVTDPRADEYAYLAGTEFPADLARAGYTLGRFRFAGGQ